MPVKQLTISDITWEELNNDYIHIYKNFWYISDFDTWTLSIYTNKEELEKLFWKSFKNDFKIWECFCCNKNIINYILESIDKSFYKNLDWFKELLEETTLTITDIWVDICNDCLEKYFGKFIKYDDLE